MALELEIIVEWLCMRRQGTDKRDGKMGTYDAANRHDAGTGIELGFLSTAAKLSLLNKKNLLLAKVLNLKVLNFELRGACQLNFRNSDARQTPA